MFFKKNLYLRDWHFRKYRREQNEGITKDEGWRNAPLPPHSTIEHSWNYLEASGKQAKHIRTTVTRKTNNTHLNYWDTFILAGQTRPSHNRGIA